MYLYFGVRVLEAMLYPVAVGFLKITIQRVRLRTQLPWTNDQSPCFLLFVFTVFLLNSTKDYVHELGLSD